MFNLLFEKFFDFFQCFIFGFRQAKIEIDQSNQSPGSERNKCIIESNQVFKILIKFSEKESKHKRQHRAHATCYIFGPKTVGHKQLFSESIKFKLLRCSIIFNRYFLLHNFWFILLTWWERLRLRVSMRLA